ncbi:MAG: amidohydrolase family protein [Candidatus Bathyarchaeota archaeon]|nr:amidohydrolase family protein [Candidatus Bathyarchaeota archaeon]
MEFSGFTGVPVVDCHVHPWPPWRTDNRLDEAALKAKSLELVETISRGRLSQMHVYGNPDHSALYLKAANPGLFYAGGYAPWSFEAKSWGGTDWPRYVESLVGLGYDGIGEMGAKPVTRDRHTPLDSPLYEGFWSACEDEGLPVVCHVGDPEEFWSEKQTPAWAKARGWGYYMGDYPALEELYAEVENFLGRHPGVEVVFPHFLFLSPHMERLEDFFTRHPGAYVDLTPGIELVYSISRRRDEWRRFFTRHADRILLGTDIGMSKTVEEHLARVWILRNFLETGDEFYTPASADELLTRYKEPFIGLDLPRVALEKICAGNFRRLWGAKPREVDVKAAASAAEKQGHAGVTEALKRVR